MQFVGMYSITSALCHAKLPDIAVNLGDGMFQGKYHGKRRHDPDLPLVLERAKAAGVTRQLLTGTNLRESKHVLELAKKYGECLF